MPKFWAFLFGIVLFACFAIFPIAYLVPGWWLPTNLSSFGPSVDHLFYLILWLTGFFFVVTLVILVYGIAKFGYDPGRKATFTHGSHTLEMLWTAVPALILLFIAFAQVEAWSNIKYQSRMPVPDQLFDVQARMWEWRFRFPTGAQMDAMIKGWKEGGPPTATAKDWYDNPHVDDLHIVNELHTWKGAKVRFNLQSRDVIHSFFLPNMRIKQDAMPGKVIPVWFDTALGEANCEWDAASKSVKVTKGPTLEMACAELCGARHSMMRGRVYVHKDKDSYLGWLAHAMEKGHATER